MYDGIVVYCGAVGQVTARHVGVGHSVGGVWKKEVSDRF